MSTSEFSFEKNGDKFLLDTLLEAREKCIQTVTEIIDAIRPGMTEADAQVIIKKTFLRYGVDQFWHPSKFRIGPDTTKNFRSPTDSDLICEAGEICFIDVGPVISEHEADFGRTFQITTGNEHSRLIQACEEVFYETAKAWKQKGLTGHGLYLHAKELTERMGFHLNPYMAGHRLGDFPHKIHSTKDLFSLEEKPSANFWVLEIHVIDPKSHRGSFYEDLLI